VLRGVVHWASSRTQRRRWLEACCIDCQQPSHPWYNERTNTPFSLLVGRNRQLNGSCNNSTQLNSSKTLIPKNELEVWHLVRLSAWEMRKIARWIRRHVHQAKEAAASGDISWSKSKRIVNYTTGFHSSYCEQCITISQKAPASEQTSERQGTLATFFWTKYPSLCDHT